MCVDSAAIAIADAVAATVVRVINVCFDLHNLAFQVVQLFL